MFTEVARGPERLNWTERYQRVRTRESMISTKFHLEGGVFVCQKQVIPTSRNHLLRGGWWGSARDDDSETVELV